MRRNWRILLAFFAVLGPGFVTASAGNDVGGIATYSAAGARFGYATLWTAILTLPLMAFILPSLMIVIGTPLALRIIDMLGRGP